MCKVIYEGIAFKQLNHTIRQKTYEVLICAELVRKAIRSGELIKQPCEICGTLDKIHAHHEDYSNPLDVRWLCSRHHSLLHSYLKRV